MSKTDKELAVDLACAALNAIAAKPAQTLKPLSFDDINNVLVGCYNAVRSLPEDEQM